jgi:hypothetical protein
VTVDRDGNLFISDTNNNRIRRVDAKTGIITTVAGSGASNGVEGYGRGSHCGDGGPALSACINTPISAAVADDGSIYISEWGFPAVPKVRKVGSDGLISTLSWPPTMKLIVGPAGTIFGHALSRIYAGDHGEARFFIGEAGEGFSGDGGPATAAQMASSTAELAAGARDR